MVVTKFPRDGLSSATPYKIARDMSNDAYNYLLGLLSVSTFPALMPLHCPLHAGILPSNPLYAMDNKNKQPLARIPVFSKPLAEDKTNPIEELRQIQEMGILTEIPQNVDPGPLSISGASLMMLFRGSLKEEGPGLKYGTSTWIACIGFQEGTGKRILSQSSIDDEDVGRNNDTPQDHDVATADTNSKNVELPCYPSTTIYGHAAGRGLDVKRWSIGLDSGCVCLSYIVHANVIV